MEVSVAVESMKLHNINAKYINDSLVEVNGISIYLNGSLAQFGTCFFRFSDVFDFVTNLSMEGLLDLSTDQKHKIKHCYEKLSSLASAPKVKL